MVAGSQYGRQANTLKRWHQFSKKRYSTTPSPPSSLTQLNHQEYYLPGLQKHKIQREQRRLIHNETKNSSNTPFDRSLDPRGRRTCSKCAQCDATVPKTRWAVSDKQERTWTRQPCYAGARDREREVREREREKKKKQVVKRIEQAQHHNETADNSWSHPPALPTSLDSELRCGRAGCTVTKSWRHASQFFEARCMVLQ